MRYCVPSYIKFYHNKDVISNESELDLCVGDEEKLSLECSEKSFTPCFNASKHEAALAQVLGNGLCMKADL